METRSSKLRREALRLKMSGTNKENGNSAFGGAVKKTVPRRGLAKVNGARDKKVSETARKKSTKRMTAASATKKAAAVATVESKTPKTKKKSIKKAPDWSKIHSKEQSLRTKRMSVYKKANTTAVEPSFSATTTTTSTSKIARPRFGRSPPSKRAEADAGTSFSRLRATRKSSTKSVKQKGAPKNNNAAHFEKYSGNNDGISGGDGFQSDGGALDSILNNTGVSVNDEGSVVDAAPIKKTHAAGLLNAQSAIERLRQKRKSLYNRPQPAAIAPAPIEAPTYQRARLSLYHRRDEEPTLAELRENATPTPEDDDSNNYNGGDGDHFALEAAAAAAATEPPATPIAAFTSTLSAAAATAKLNAIGTMADDFEVNNNALDSILGGAGVAEEISSKESRKSVYFGALRVAASNQNAKSKNVRNESGMAPVTPRRRTGGVAATPRSARRPAATTRGGGGGGGGGPAPATPSLFGGRDLPTESPFLIKAQRRQFGVLIDSPGQLDPMSVKKDAITRRLSMGAKLLRSEPAPAFEMMEGGVAQQQQSERVGSTRKLSEASKQSAMDALELIRLEEEELELELERELEQEEAAIKVAEEAMKAKETAAAAAAAAAIAAAAAAAAAAPKVTAIVTEGGKRLTVMNFKKAKAKTVASTSAPAPAPAPVVIAASTRKFGGSAFKPVTAPAAAQTTAAAAVAAAIRADTVDTDDEDNEEMMGFAAYAESHELPSPREMKNPFLRNIGAGDPRDYEFIPIAAKEAKEAMEAMEAPASALHEVSAPVPRKFGGSAFNAVNTTSA